MPGTKDGELLERGQGVAHAAARMPHDELERGRVVGEALLAADVGKVRLHLVVSDRMKVKALHAGEDRGEDLLRVGDKDHVLGWLLERLEQRVERRRREHVDLVDDVDLRAAHDRGVAHSADDLLADVVHAGARGGVQLDDIRMLARRDEAALIAAAVGQRRRAPLAHERLGQDARHRGLSRAARTAEQVRVTGAALEHGALQGLDHVRLAHDLIERLRAILGVERFHAASGTLVSEVPVYPRQRRDALRPQVLLACGNDAGAFAAACRSVGK